MAAGQDGFAAHVDQQARQSRRAEGNLGQSLGTDMVEIVMPSVSGSTAKEKQVEAEEIRNIIRTTGALEFRILATKRFNESLIEMAKAERMKFPVDYDKTVIIKDHQDRQRVGQVVPRPRGRGRQNQGRRCRHGGRKDQGQGQGRQGGGEGRLEVLVLSPESDAYNVTGGDIRDAHSAHEPGIGFARSRLLVQPGGGTKFGRLTGEHVPIGDFKYQVGDRAGQRLANGPQLDKPDHG